VFALGSHIARHEVRVNLEGEGADVNLDGLYLPRGDQLHDNPVLVVHAAPAAPAASSTRAWWTNKATACSTDTSSSAQARPALTPARRNKNLLLSDDAEIDTRPRLEILTDDVKCAHGAAVGRLDEEALF